MSFSRRVTGNEQSADACGVRDPPTGLRQGQFLSVCASILRMKLQHLQPAVTFRGQGRFGAVQVTTQSKVRLKWGEGEREGFFILYGTPSFPLSSCRCAGSRDYQGRGLARRVDEIRGLIEQNPGWNRRRLSEVWPSAGMVCGPPPTQRHGARTLWAN